MATQSTEVPGGYGGRPSARSTAESPSVSREQRQRSHARRNVAGAAHDARATQALGWFSIALGLTAFFAPRALGQLSGVGPRTGLLRMIGLRELGAGAGLLTARDATPWLWSRVAGDTMDLLVLGAAAGSSQRSTRARSLISLALVAGVTAADVAASVRQSRRRITKGRTASLTDGYLERSVIVNRSPQECYAYWRDFGNLPNFMRMIDAVTDLGDRRSHWVARLPGGIPFEWDSRISEDLPGERIAWHSSPESPLLHAGVVSFGRAPGERGTIVSLVVHYRPPAGALGRSVAKTFGAAPEFEIMEDLRRFKQILETNEIPTTRGQPSGRRSVLARMARRGKR